MKNKLLEKFKVNNFKELLDYIENHPEEKEVKEIKKIIEKYTTKDKGDM